MNTEELKMTDTAISHIAKLLQMAILTGTDIMDNLRSATFVVHKGKLELHPDYQETFDINIQNMVDTLGVPSLDDETSSD